MYKVTSTQVFSYRTVSKDCYQVLHQERVEAPTSVNGWVYQAKVIGQVEKRWVERWQAYRWVEVGTNDARYNIHYKTRLAASYGIIKQRNRITLSRLQPAF